MIEIMNWKNWVEMQTGRIHQYKSGNRFTEFSAKYYTTEKNVIAKNSKYLCESRTIAHPRLQITSVNWLHVSNAQTEEDICPTDNSKENFTILKNVDKSKCPSSMITN